MKPALHIELTPSSVTGFESPEADRAPLAKLLRSIYISEYKLYVADATQVLERVLPMWDGIRTSSGSVHQPVWPRLAEFVVAHRMNPKTLIKLEFAHARGKALPAPSMLQDDAAVERYSCYMAGQLDRLREELQLGLDSFEVQLCKLSLIRRLTPEQRHAMALADYRVSATPLLRYCLAVRIGLPGVANHYCEAAMVEYVFDMENYDAAWGPAIIPEAFRTAALGLQSRIFGQPLGIDQTSPSSSTRGGR